MDPLLVLFNIIVLIFSVVIHEISHGFTAEMLGDPTARKLGRLTLNPLKHLDPFGSVLLPLALYFLTSGGLVFGWAKPVPYNPFNLKDPVWSAGRIAAAGPLSNFLLAAIFGTIIRFFGVALGPHLVLLFGIIVYVNLFLTVFNLIPIPPLDGSKVLFALLPRREGAVRFAEFLERYGFVILVFVLFSGLSFVQPIVRWLFRLVAG